MSLNYKAIMPGYYVFLFKAGGMGQGIVMLTDLAVERITINKRLLF